MENKKAIEAIRSHWPDERYLILREALGKAIAALECGTQPASTNSAMDAIALIKNIESYVNLCFSVVDSCKVRINMTKKSWSKLLKIARQHQ